MFKKVGVHAIMFVALLSLYGCAATGPKLETVKGLFPPIGENSGRLFFYRVYSGFGSGMRPDILVCGKKVGESIPGGAFYVDLPAGECDITVPGILYPTDNKVSVTISPQGVQYIRTWIGGSGFGGRTNMEFVPEATAIEAMNDLALTNSTKP
jgi:hypothetical protein